LLEQLWMESLPQVPSPQEPLQVLLLQVPSPQEPLQVLLLQVPSPQEPLQVLSAVHR
jgi:hypothetical protein